MKTKTQTLPPPGQIKKIGRIIKKTLKLVTLVMFLAGLQVLAADWSQLSQTINDGTLAVDIVDSSGASVSNPSVTFGALTYSFDTQDGTGTLGTSDERIRAYNPTSTDTWTVNLAGSSTTATWSDGSHTYDFNDGSGYTDGSDADSVGGQMTVDPSGATITGVSGCSTSNISTGSSDSYVEGTTDNIDLMSASSGAATYCRWDLTGVNLTQGIPAGQSPGTYTLTMNLTIS